MHKFLVILLCFIGFTFNYTVVIFHILFWTVLYKLLFVSLWCAVITPAHSLWDVCFAYTHVTGSFRSLVRIKSSIRQKGKTNPVKLGRYCKMDKNWFSGNQEKILWGYKAKYKVYVWLNFFFFFFYSRQILYKSLRKNMKNVQKFI